MRKKLLFILLIISSLSTEFSISQTYVPFLNNSSWNITVANFGGQYNLIINQGTDVVIGSFTYKKFIEPYYQNDVYIREDVTTKRVYKLVNGFDQLLYDFSLQVSNTITLSNGLTYTVTSITDVNVSGGTRRKFNLYNFAGGETWIEGVGSNNHPLIPHYELPSDPYIYLTCSAQNGQSIYNHGLANGSTPTDCSMLLSTNDYQNLNKQISFYPNPFNTELTISSETSLENLTLKIFNSLGQLVKEIENLNGNSIKINRENINNGIYQLQLIKNDKIINRSSVIITN